MARQRLVKLLIAADRPVKQARVGVLGLTFKENVPDLRNSRVPDIITELAQFGIKARVHDPHADPDEARGIYGLELQPLEALQDLDALVLAVPHQAYRSLPATEPGDASRNDRNIAAYFSALTTPLAFGSTVNS